MTVADLEGSVVIARAVGWDSPGSSEWALDRSDMPRMTRLIGPLIVNYVDDLDYTQYVVNGIPVDPATVTAASLPGQVLIASAANVPRDENGRWTKGGGVSTGKVPSGVKTHQTPFGEVKTSSMKPYLLVGEDSWGGDKLKIVTASNDPSMIQEKIRYSSGTRVDGSPLRLATVNQITGEVAEVQAGNQPKKAFAALVAADLFCPDCGLPEYPTEFKQLDVGRVPRDDSGKWCKGAGCNSGVGIQSTDDPVKFAKNPPDLRLAAPDEWFASDDDWAATKALANEKARNVPKPSKETIARNKEQARRAKEEGKRAGGELRGNSYTRRARGEALFEEFGGLKKKFVPCTHCGIKTSPGGRGGFAPMEQDKILTLNEGGGYGTPRSFPNLIPSCSGCNKSRGESPYPVRPSWSGTGMSVLRSGFRITEAEASDRVDDEVVAFPMYWNEPWYDGPNAPVQGILGKRDLDMFWGRYTQWIVGGVVVDPAHIYDLDDPLVAAGSAMCIDCGGWLVASGAAPAAKDVPRDPAGKWCKGLQCQGQMQIGGLESPMEGPSLSGKSVEYDQMSPGQKAAWTKKQKALEAQSAEAQAKALADQIEAENIAKQKIVDEGIRQRMNQNIPLTDSEMNDASMAVVDDYLATNLSPKQLDQLPADQKMRRVEARKINDQHVKDQVLLETVGHYGNESPRDSRRAVLRETGVRRPTGGPNPGGEHVFYGESQISAMPRNKQEMIVLHHSGGQLKPQDVAGMSDSDIRQRAVTSDALYKQNVTTLKQEGWTSSSIPHSAASSGYMKNGGNALPGGGGKIAKPVATVTSAKPGGAKPPEWDSWGPGQKAAWTKGQKVKGSGSINTSPSKSGVKTALSGKHTVNEFSTSWEAKKAFRARVDPAKGSTEAGTASQRASAQRSGMTQEQKAVISNYAGGGYVGINQHLKGNPQYSNPKYGDQANVLRGALEQHGTPAPKQLLRGKSSGPLADLDYKVGDVYTEPSFTSFSTSRRTAFGSTNGGGYFLSGSSNRGVATKVVDSKGAKSLVANIGEKETILPPGTKYRVVGIEDFVGGGAQLRYIEVEVVV